MATPSPIQIEIAFDRLWASWPNKQGEQSALKAFTVAIRSGEDYKKIEHAAKIYLLDQAGMGPDFLYRLHNFIREDHWKDYAEAGDKLLKKEQEALELIKEWNKACKRHWCYISHPESRVSTAMKALNDKAFAEEWRLALKKAEGIFRYPFREGDIKEKITLSFAWFCKLGEKHTVLRIMEGGYGEAQKEPVIKIIPSVPIDHEARKELAEEVLQMFPDLKKKVERKVRLANRTEDKVEISPEAQAIVNDMKSQLGKKPRHAKESSIESIAKGILKALPQEAERGAEDEDDPFAFRSADST